MRRQDELICIYGGQPNLARKFLLTQMEGLSLAFDSEELLEFLQTQVGDPDPIVARQALFSLARFLPGYVRKRYMLSGQSHGTWSLLGSKKSTVKERMQDVARQEARGEECARAALMATQPIAAGLVDVLKGAQGWARTRAILTLGQFALKTASRWLADALAADSPDLLVNASLANLRGREMEPRLVSTAREFGPSDADLYLLLGACRSAEAFSVLIDAVRRTDVVGRMNLARALASFDSLDVTHAITALCARPEPWVVISLLGSVETLGAPALLPWVQRMYEAAPHEFIKAQAVKAAGGIRCQEAVGFCMDVARTGTGSARAMAIESLVRLRAERRSLKQVAAPLLGSPDLRSNVNAILALLTADEALTSRALGSLLMSADVLHRLEAAYCLGYLQSKPALGCLEALCRRDPSGAVRQQAVKSLSRYKAGDALPILVSFIQGDDARLAILASRVATRYEGSDAGLACQLLITTLTQATRPLEKALLYRVLGPIAHKTGNAGAADLASRGLGDGDPRVVGGALESLILLGPAVPPETRARLADLSSRGEPRLRARAMLARWHSGELDAPAALAGLLCSRDEKGVDAALECCLEIGLLLSSLSRDRFPELSRNLLATVGTGSYAAFVAEQIDLGDEEGPVSPAQSRPLDSDFETRRTAAAESVGARDSGTMACPARSPGVSKPMPAVGQDASSSRILAPGRLNDLLDRLGKEKPRNDRLRQRLTGQNYLVADLIPRSGALTWLLRAPLGRAVVLAAFLLAFGAFLALRPSAPPPPADPESRAPKGPLWVSQVQPPADCAGTPLAVQRVLTGRDVVKVGAGGEAVLATPRGHMVRIRAASSLAFEGVAAGEGPDTQVYRFADPSGSIVLDFHKNAQVEVSLGSSRITARDAVLAFDRDTRDRAVVILRSGRATLESPKGVVALQPEATVVLTR